MWFRSILARIAAFIGSNAFSSKQQADNCAVNIKEDLQLSQRVEEVIIFHNISHHNKQNRCEIIGNSYLSISLSDN